MQYFLPKVIASRRDVFNRLCNEGKVGKSYRKDIKYKVMGGIPKMSCSVLVEDNNTTPPTLTYTRDLKAIPARLWKNRTVDNKRYNLENTLFLCHY